MGQQPDPSHLDNLVNVEGEANALGLVTHTPNPTITQKFGSFLKTLKDQNPLGSVSSMKKRCKNQPTQTGPNSPSLAATMQQSGPSHHDTFLNAHRQIDDQEQSCYQMSPHQSMQQGPNQVNNQFQEAEKMWLMEKELGVTCGNVQRDHVQQLVDMEERDIKEAKKLGGRRRCPWISFPIMWEG